jgi:DNA-binding PadR family transcriptional regulator
MSQAPRLPEITHLQFVVLAALINGERRGRELRTLLKSYGLKNSAPAFYQMMGRLETAGLVDGWYEQKIVRSQHIKERRYRLTKAGDTAVADTQRFYSTALAARPRIAHA